MEQKLGKSSLCKLQNMGNMVKKINNIFDFDNEDSHQKYHLVVFMEHYDMTANSPCISYISSLCCENSI